MMPYIILNIKIARHLTSEMPFLPSTQPLTLNHIIRVDKTLSDIIYIPPSLDIDAQRRLGTKQDRRLAQSINLGDGKCKWQPPRYEVPETIDFYKTLIAGFPSGDKRMIWLQMEALAGWREFRIVYDAVCTL